MTNTPPKPTQPKNYIPFDLFDRLSVRAHFQGITVSELLEALLERDKLATDISNCNSDTQNRLTNIERNLGFTRVINVVNQLDTHSQHLANLEVRINLLHEELLEARSERHEQVCVLDRDLTLPDELG